LFVAALLAWAVVSGASDLRVQAQSGRLRVATKPLEPFVVKKGDRWAGFSIDLWDAIARRLAVEYEWIEVTSVKEQLDAVQSGLADVAIAGISMTAERERSSSTSATPTSMLGCRS
jgi:polar amino acid transport system substrate-binding protein